MVVFETKDPFFYKHDRENGLSDILIMGFGTNGPFYLIGND